VTYRELGQSASHSRQEELVYEIRDTERKVRLQVVVVGGWRVRVEARERGEVDEVDRLQQAAAYETDGVKARGSRFTIRSSSADRSQQKEAKGM